MHLARYSLQDNLRRLRLSGARLPGHHDRLVGGFTARAQTHLAVGQLEERRGGGVVMRGGDGRE